MSLSKEHYKAIAEIISRNTIVDLKNKEYISKKHLSYRIIEELCIYFKEDNTNFNREKFINACNE